MAEDLVCITCGIRGAANHSIGDGQPFPRCDSCWEKRLELEADLKARYPISAPDDFDTGYCGEAWGEDDY